MFWLMYFVVNILVNEGEEEEKIWIWNLEQWVFLSCFSCTRKKYMRLYTVHRTHFHCTITDFLHMETCYHTRIFCLLNPQY